MLEINFIILHFWMHVHWLGSDIRQGANLFRLTIMHVHKKVAALTLTLTITIGKSSKITLKSAKNSFI